MLLGRADGEHDPVVSAQVGLELHPVEVADPHRDARTLTPEPNPRRASVELATMNTAQDDAVMAGASGTQTVAAADGRSLTVAEWGDPGGFPVFSLHGTPGSRFVGQADASAYASVGARVITYDRPGYGGSDRFRGRRVVDSAADVSAIADSLGVDRFAVTGGSWGGPHSLGVAARLPERVTRAACTAGVAPFDMPGFDWFAGMDAVNIDELGWALEGEDVLAREIERTAAGMLERVADDPSKAISDKVGLSEADRAVMASPERHEAIRRGINEAFRQGVWGYVDDIFCLIQPWGFEVTEIRVPTRILYGLTDVLVPRQHGEWLAQNVPDAEAVIDEQGGHMPDPNLVTERFAWLVQPV
jgi:pimeloyl-ACP methyl ester carboxylesterase